jgi:CO/xanthine dehydrogenase Mo-binding subunit
MIAAPGGEAVAMSHREVGRSVERKDGLAKVTGAAQYLDDLTVPGVAYAALLRSPYAHARITKVEVARAAAAPDVLAVVTPESLGEMGGKRFGSYTKDQFALAQDIARYEGEPVAAVVASTEAAARAAAGLIDAEYEPLAAVVDVEGALASDAPLVHETPPPLGRQGRWPPVPGTNICARVVLEQGDLAAGFRDAELIVERTYTFPRVFHYTREPHGAVASVTPSEITVWTNTGHPYQLRQELADTFGLSLGRIRVIVPYVGGSFGGKSFPKLEPLACLLSWKVGCPVKVLNGVEGSMRTNRRHGARATVKLGVRRDGTITAKDCRVLLDGGAYADSGPLVAEKASIRMLGPYRAPHYRVEVLTVYTNMIEYRVPLVTDVPRVVQTVLVENGDGVGPFGAKGMGEGGGIPVAPAVANAVARATGVRIRELPLTPERVWTALRAARRAPGREAPPA